MVDCFDCEFTCKNLFVCSLYKTRRFSDLFLMFESNLDFQNAKWSKLQYMSHFHSPQSVCNAYSRSPKQLIHFRSSKIEKATFTFKKRCFRRIVVIGMAQKDWSASVISNRGLHQKCQSTFKYVPENRTGLVIRCPDKL